MRYWDGHRWTRHVGDHGVQSSDPPARSLLASSSSRPLWLIRLEAELRLLARG